MNLLMILILFLNSGLHIEAKAGKLIPKFIINLIKSKADHILEASVGNTQCARDFRIVLSDALHLKKWALQMFDATGKPSSGILFGNIYMNGNFDECLSIHETKGNTSIRGQYCTVLLTPSVEYNTYFDFSSAATITDYLGINTSTQITDVLKTIKMTYGICIPQSCSIGHLQKLWDHIEHAFRVPVHVNFVDMMCTSKVKNILPYDVDTFIYTFFGIYMIIILLSTAYDFLVYQNINGEKNNLWISFSLYTNIKKLIKINDDDNYLDAISGLKVINMLWVIYGHRVLLNVVSGLINLIYISEWKSQIFTTINLSASYAVDTFLLLSGLLLSYGILNYQSYKQEEVKITIASLYINRFLRLTPGLLALILFNISIFKHLNSGPIWPLIATKSSKACLKTGIFTLLFVNNYIDINYQCVEHAWYLAVDSQLYFISPIVLISLLRRPLKTCLLCIGACIFSGIYTFVITFRNNYGAIYFESNKPYLTYIYQSTLVRMPPWFIGIVYGYIFFKYRNIKLKGVVNSLGWIIAFSTLSGLILVHLVFTATFDYDVINAAFFNSTARQLWALAMGLLLFLCTINRDGKIHKFLSLPIFRIVVRMSYSVYLTHGLVLLYFIGGKKHSTHFGNILNIHDFLGDLLFVFAVATLWCLAFESPFIAVSKYFYNRAKSSEALKKKANQKRKKTKKNKNNYLVCVYKYEEDEELSYKKIT